MAAKVCTDCGIAIPQSETVNCCPRCEGRMEYKAAAQPETDWREQVERAQVDAHVRTHEPERIEAWRIRSALELGVTLELAEEFAHSHADRQQLADLIASGCEPDTAARIVI